MARSVVSARDIARLYNYTLLAVAAEKAVVDLKAALADLPIRRSSRAEKGSKQALIERLLLQRGGTNQVETLPLVGWESISFQEHARIGGLRLLIEKKNGRFDQYHASKR